MSKSKKSMQHIQDFLIEIAQGNFSPKLKISINDDEQIQTVKIGINMLAEELSSSVISRTFLNSIYNGINDMLIVIDEHGKIQKTNLVLETSLLFNEEELLNKPVEIIIHFNDVDTVRKHIQNALIFSNIQEVAINFVSKDKTIIPVLCSFSIIQDSSNKSTKVLLAAKNISALLSARDQLRDKNEELNLFIYKASHDLKSPVSSMLGLMQLVKKCSNMDEMKEYVHFMDRSINKLDGILNELLIIGKITHGELDFKRIDVAGILKDVLEGVVTINSGVTVKLNIDKSIKFILSEKGLFQSILFNLISNAFKYRNTFKVPYLKINVTKKDKGILITIEDNGVGIREEDQTNLFKMFYRANTSYDGTGLGLYIVKTSLNKLGGEVSLKSTAGVGSTFYVYLPCEIV